MMLGGSIIEDAAGGATNTIRPLTPTSDTSRRRASVDATPENWLPVVGWEDLYEVSDQGRVRSLDRETTSTHGPTGSIYTRIFKGRVVTPLSDGKYLRVQLCRDGAVERHRTHRLVAHAFIGPCPTGMYVCHWNDDPTDNRLLNLRYATPSENNFDMVRNGGHWEANMTHCKYGHEFTAETTYINPSSGARRCRICKKASR